KVRPSHPGFVRDQGSLDDKAARCVAEYVECVAGDERERLLRRGIQHVYVVRRDNQRLADLVVVHAVGRRELHLIAQMDMTERTKHGVAMTSDADVARLPGKRRVLDVAGSAAERSVVSAFEYG